MDHDDDDDDDHTLQLFQQEETPVLEVFFAVPPVPHAPRPYLYREEEEEEAALDTHHHIDTTTTLCLQLTQYGSSDDRWGIHSCVWQGGIALTQYILSSGAWSHHSPTTTTTTQGVIDLGSGTGIVGLALAAGMADTVCCTDLPQALPLLRHNQRQPHTRSTRDSTTPTTTTPTTPTTLRVEALPWGAPIGWAQRTWLPWLESSVDATRASTTAAVSNTTQPRPPRHMLITGADIVYRPSLFEPLIVTLLDLLALYDCADAILTTTDNNNNNNDVGTDDNNNTTMACRCTILLSCQSKRSHLDQFWKACAAHGLEQTLVAVVRLDEDAPTDGRRCTVTHTTPSQESWECRRSGTTNDDDGNTRELEKGEYINWIFELRKRSVDDVPRKTYSSSMHRQEKQHTTMVHSGQS